MKYDPKNPLSEQELDKLGKEDFDGFIEYLDGMVEHKKRKKNPRVKEMKEKKRQVLRDTGIYKIKTNRDQWFD
tara:strand:- start:338 stop:556 length:219 start_codon:yes stop_codon:yes gene_type:complete